ncbi:MAG: hypothetical protein R2814_05870 [Flavobacteriaceae bacterium]
MNLYNMVFKYVWPIALFFNAPFAIQGQKHHFESHVPKFNYPTTLKQPLNVLESDSLRYRKETTDEIST